MIDDTLTPDETKQRLEHVNDFHEKNVKLNYFKLILVLCFSFLEGCFVPLFADITLEAITCKILFGFVHQFMEFMLFFSFQMQIQRLKIHYMVQ